MLCNEVYRNVSTFSLECEAQIKTMGVCGAFAALYQTVAANVSVSVSTQWAGLSIYYISCV